MSKLPAVGINPAHNFWGNIPGWVLISDYQPANVVGHSVPYALLLEGISSGKIKSLTCNKSARQAVLKSEADAYIADRRRQDKPVEPKQGLNNVFHDLPGWVQLSSYDNRMNKLSGPKTKEYKTLAKAIVRGELSCVHHSRSKKVGVNKEAADAFLQKKLYSKYEVATQVKPIETVEAFRFLTALSELHLTSAELHLTRCAYQTLLEDLESAIECFKTALSEKELIDGTNKTVEAKLLQK